MSISPDQLPLGFLLNTVGRLMNAEATEVFAARGLDPVLVGVLIVVGLMPGRSQREYAAYQARDVTTYGRLVDKLAARGLLERRALPADRRAWALALTPAGEAAVADLTEEVRSLEGRYTAALGPEEAVALRRALATILAGAGGLEPAADREADAP